MRPTSLALALALGLPALAGAQNTARQLDAVVVTATRSPDASLAPLAATTVLTREDIERSQAPDLIDLLARQAGVDVSRTGGPGSVSTLFLRGSNSNHTLVLIDGIRVNAAQQGLYDFANLPLERIERIEIVRGPRAALWGSDAIGGVIQIFTRDATARGVQLRAGSFERREAAAQWGFGDGERAFGIGAGLIDMEGYNASTPANFSFDPDKDGFRNRHLGLAGRTGLGRQTLAGRALFTRADVEFDRGESEVRNRQLGATLAGPLADRWSHSLAVGHDRQDLLTRSSFGSRFDSRRASLDWVNDVALGRGQTLLFGLNHSEEDATSKEASGSVVYDRSRRNTGLFLAWRGRAEGQSWDLAARLDDNSQFGSTTTAQAAWGFEWGQGWQARLGWGQGFRAPSTNELYSPGFGGFFAGNPALRPERSRNLEAGLGWQGSDSRVAFSAYRSRVADLIAFAGPLFQAVNVQQAELDGVELEGHTRLGRLAIGGHLGWQRAENASTGAALLRRAPRKAALSLDLPLGETFSLGLDTTAAARRQDFDGPLGGYARVDLRAEARLGGGWVLRGRLENLLDRDYTLASGFATPGRSGLLELAWQPRS